GARSAGLRRPSILVVDDDGAFRSALVSELERMDFDVHAAASGEEAVQRVVETESDVVLLDVRLPGMSGLEALREIRARAPRTDVIMLTGHGTIDTALEAVRAGAFDYVGKPCPLDDLEVRIRRAIERQTLRLRASLLERRISGPSSWGRRRRSPRCSISSTASRRPTPRHSCSARRGRGRRWWRS